AWAEQLGAGVGANRDLPCEQAVDHQQPKVRLTPPQLGAAVPPPDRVLDNVGENLPTGELQLIRAEVLSQVGIVLKHRNHVSQETPPGPTIGAGKSSNRLPAVLARQPGSGGPNGGRVSARYRPARAATA